MKLNSVICVCVILFGAVVVKSMPQNNETNLFRILEVITAQNEHPAPRQTNEDVVGVVILPQVAQILDSVFKGPLDITRVVDGIVPLNIRKGILQLLRGEDAQLGPSTVRIPVSQEPDAFKEPTTKASGISTSTLATTTEKRRYKVRPRTKVPLVDDEFERYERSIVEEGGLMPPYEPRNRRNA